MIFRKQQNLKVMLNFISGKKFKGGSPVFAEQKPAIRAGSFLEKKSEVWRERKRLFFKKGFSSLSKEKNLLFTKG